MYSTMEKEQLDAFAEYQQMVDSIFGEGIISVVRNDVGNNIINTWGRVDEFIVFKELFFERLSRLQASYKSNKNINVIYNLVANIGDEKNWEGTYAELVAYDVLNTEYNSEFSLDVTRKANFALADKLGMKMINYDIHMNNDYGVFMDVKAFTDTVGDILNNSIIGYVIKQNDFKDIRIGVQPEYPLDDNDEDYKHNIQPLRNELDSEIRKMLDSNRKQLSYTSNILPRVTFKILIGSGMLGTTSVYNPYRRAEQLKDMVIKRYCNKLPYSEPFFLVFVNFPWFNQRDNNAFGDCNKALYRSIARRTFMQYENNDEKIHNINTKYQGNDEAKVAAHKLTGIIFIDDHSIIKNSQDIYIYLNPLADNKRPQIDMYLNALIKKSAGGDYDNLEHDNY